MSNLYQDNVERENEFFKELGHALIEWQRVEGETYRLYSTLMRGADRTLISVNFHHIQSFESRLQLLDRCMFFVASEPAKAAWKELRKRAETLAGIRNELVHSAFIIEGKTDGSHTPTIAPSHFDAIALVRKRAMNDAYRHDTDRIHRHAHLFRKLAGDMRTFRESATLRIATKAELAAARKSSSRKSKGRSA